ncbi:MAG: geranylgeranylglycerol-phosphate geranylgeranyltransferase [Candidatus Coatesbacteria bacterium]|nr:MAG: geranylgeranylglycerol-phosphate geranylgeranyltransferase [Candidatus Coatesbacteria bacterium]
MGAEKRSPADVIYGLIGLIRPVNLLLLFAMVLLGAYLSTGEWYVEKYVLAGLAFCLMAAGGYAANDVADLATDRINKPRRPLSSGAIAAREAVALGAVLFTAGLVAAAILGVRTGAAGLLYGALYLFYNWVVKGKGILANATSATFFIMALVFGWTAGAGALSRVVFPVAIFWLYVAAREIYKDAGDLFGDKITGRNTLPVVLGAGAACNVAAVLLGAFILLTPLPYLCGLYSGVYLAFIVPVDALIIYLAVQNLRKFEEHRVIFTYKFMKALLFLAAVGIYWGAADRTVV